MNIVLFFEIIKSIIFGIVEGITEWLPISSTGHMILLKDILDKSGSLGMLANAEFADLYLYVIQLGAILAVVTLYFHRLNPFALSKSHEEKTNTWHMWFKVVVACVPAAVIGLVLDDYMEKIENWYVVSAMLIVYGIAFILVEKLRKKPTVDNMAQMTYKTAFLIGLFQVLSIIPGTSRSGATILGAMLIGCSRPVAAEFSFFLAIPVMFGVSLLKIAKNGLMMAGGEWAVLITGMIVAYAVSLLAIKFLMSYVRNHDFKAFGYYRIIIGILVIAYFTLAPIFA